MTARSYSVRAGKIVLLPFGLAIAAAAFVHAGSETKSLSIGLGASSRLGLDANIAGALADAGFRAEMASRQAQAPNEFPRLPDPLIALARDSFAADPLEVSSLRTLALGSVLPDDEARARRVMRLASQISKRDSITNLWLAQDYGRAGDVEAMLASFDHALRTNARAREFAMKPVVGALASDESYAPLGKLLAGHPEWEVDFWREFASNPVAAANAAEFFAGSGIPLDRVPDETREELYATLKREQRFDTLYSFAARDPVAKASEATLVAGKFVSTREGNPLGWTLHSRGNASAQVHRSTGELQIDARSGSFGVAADRIVRVEGDQTLVIAMAEAVPDNARLKLAVKCADEAKSELAVISLEPGDKNGEIRFTAGGCAFASLELSFIADSGRRDAFIRVARIEMRAT
jgi:hypothetical protein